MNPGPHARALGQVAKILLSITRMQGEPVAMDTTINVEFTLGDQ